jgi:hypothetical protein
MANLTSVYDISEKIIMENIRSYYDFRKYLLIVENEYVRTQLFYRFIGNFTQFKLDYIILGEETYVKQRIPGDELDAFWPRNRVKLDITGYHDADIICENVYHIVLHTNQINRHHLEKYAHVKRLTILDGLHFNMRQLCEVFPNLEYFSTESYEQFNEMPNICRTLKKIKLAKYSPKNDTRITRSDVTYRFVVNDGYDLHHLNNLYGQIVPNIKITLVVNPRDFASFNSNYFAIDKMRVHGKYDAYPNKQLFVPFRFADLRKLSFAINTDGMPLNIRVCNFEKLERVVIDEISGATCFCSIYNVPFILFCIHGANVVIDRDVTTANIHKELILQ